MADQALSTNTITTVVTDNGTPPLSATNSFIVVVTEAPLTASLIQSGGSTTIRWNAKVGYTYRVQYKDDLTSPTWQNLPPDVVATSSTATVTDPAPGPKQRFYRILLVQ